MKLTKVSLRSFLFFLFIATLTGCDVFSNRVLNQVVVSVEDKRLTTQELSKSLAQKLKSLDALSAKDPRVISQFKERIVSDFIVESLMLLWFEEKQLSLSSEEVEVEIKKLVRGYPDDSTFREALSEEGISFAQWKNRLETSLKRKKIFELLTKEMPAPTESELESFYVNNKTRYMIKDGVLVTNIIVEDENQAEIVQKLSKKEKFEELIKKYSMGSNAQYGGQFGWIERDTFPEIFDRLFRARVGEVTGPFRLTDGVYLFKVEQKRTSRARLFAECREQVRNEVLALRETARFSAWLDEQIKRYKIFKNSTILDSLYVETR